ncbi:hypothetical protein ACHAWF_018648 [Thalassiosira exigua]
MSQPPADLEAELGIPLDATLETASPLSRPVQLLFAVAKDAPSSLVAVARTSTPGPGSGSSPAHVSPESSMRGDSARCLVVGRQASAADVRIDHKSVSRRHTALYYENRAGGAVLVVHDLGGKHGTYVNDSRLEKNGRMELPMDTGKEHMVRFGNAPSTCSVIIPPSETRGGQPQPHNKNVVEKDDVNMQQQNLSEQKTEKPPTPVPVMEENEGPSTRGTREAQIAAMIASLDSDPVYKKYVPPSEDENGVVEATNIEKLGIQSHDTSGKNVKSNNLHRNSNANKYNLPITSSITLSPKSNSFNSSDGTDTQLQANASVSALCFEPSGARIVAGHRDGTLRFYDFHGMQPTASSSGSSSDITYPPFRIVDLDNDPLDQTGRHVLTSLGSSQTGGQWIVGTTSAQPKVLDREGRATLFYFIKGDVYVTDSSQTKGHTAGVTGVAFHPLIKEVCWTCGMDGSIRQWDLSGRGKTQFKKLLCQKVIGKCKNDKGQRTQIVSNLSVHPSGRKLVVGTACGSIQIWNCFGSVVNSRPMGAVYSAHGGSKPVTFVTFSGNGDRIASRSESDDTVRIWDANKMESGTGSFGRKFRSTKEGGHPPSLLLAVCKGLPALNELNNCAFGPDGRMICAGTSVDQRGKRTEESDANGKVKFYQLPEEEKPSGKKSGSKSSPKRKETVFLDPIEEVGVAPNASVLLVQWHPKLNQIAVGASNGIIQVLYDPNISTKGALLPASKSIRQSDGLSDLLRSRAPTGSAAFLSSANSNIIVPNALPLFREEPRATRKTKEQERKDPEKTKLPQPPVTGGVKTGGGTGGGVTFTQYIVESTNYINNKNIAGKDPREELFKYNEGKSYVSPAYEGDVQRILAEKTVEEEEADLKSNKRQKTK